MGFTRTADNMGAYKYNDVIHAYIELMSYDKVRNDSEKRNKVLFDKPGIPSSSHMRFNEREILNVNTRYFAV